MKFSGTETRLMVQDVPSVEAIYRKHLQVGTVWMDSVYGTPMMDFHVNPKA